MSTRAIYTVIAPKEPMVHIYIHHDGYPTGAADHIAAALPYAWPLPRFEPDEFAAALCAGNKRSGGGVRIFKSKPLNQLHTMARDIEYRYEIRCFERQLYVSCFATSYWDEIKEEKLFAGDFASFTKWAIAEHEKEMA